jgi:hypothetical protein
MSASEASARSCSSAAALPLLGSAGLDAGACEERAERRGVPLTELRFERRLSGDDMVGCVGFQAVVYCLLLVDGLLFVSSYAKVRLRGDTDIHEMLTLETRSAYKS